LPVVFAHRRFHYGVALFRRKRRRKRYTDVKRALSGGEPTTVAFHSAKVAISHAPALFALGKHATFAERKATVIPAPILAWN